MPGNPQQHTPRRLYRDSVNRELNQRIIHVDLISEVIKRSQHYHYQLDGLVSALLPFQHLFAKNLIMLKLIGTSFFQRSTFLL